MTAKPSRLVWATGLWDLRAYITSPASVLVTPFPDPVTFTKVFGARPHGCRFAVARRDPSQDKMLRKIGYLDHLAEEPFVVWDLYDEQLVQGYRAGPAGMISPPPPLWTGTSESGLIMKAMMLFEKGGAA